MPSAAEALFWRETIHLLARDALVSRCLLSSENFMPRSFKNLKHCFRCEKGQNLSLHQLGLRRMPAGPRVCEANVYASVGHAFAWRECQQPYVYAAKVYVILNLRMADVENIGNSVVLRMNCTCMWLLVYDAIHMCIARMHNTYACLFWRMIQYRYA